MLYQLSYTRILNRESLPASRETHPGPLHPCLEIPVSGLETMVGVGFEPT